MLPDVINDMPDVAHELRVRWVALSSPALQLEGGNVKHMDLIMCVLKMIRLLHAATRDGTYTQTFVSHLLLRSIHNIVGGA